MLDCELLCRKRTHTVPKKDKRLAGIFFSGDTAELTHVANQRIEASRAEIAEMLGR
ncbi:MAG TPA: hypothetical protein VKE70_03090 [Candidatus Solibacter sp.]|nr:hypothetical protein [Candidatus Solibacter sp.]